VWAPGHQKDINMTLQASDLPSVLSETTVSAEKVVGLFSDIQQKWSKSDLDFAEFKEQCEYVASTLGDAKELANNSNESDELLSWEKRLGVVIGACNIFFRVLEDKLQGMVSKVEVTEGGQLRDRTRFALFWREVSKTRILENVKTVSSGLALLVELLKRCVMF
jgi:hypothetical protein